ncbi:TcaA second domain-containing protein [Staphylococcus simulans]|uniref:TcaA second domain-containing protein n=1 Tax=Staphylococcus simulans TaxID=1286 RepID=UPI000E68DAF0|nr:zinc-ribbon domain-containing protein [Staphylococcus simulans]RIN77070.1 zinc-ribbon domain-containing protein [Staphylococcus simulans]
MKFCRNCGHKLKEGQKVCPQCGTPTNQTPKRSNQNYHSEPRQPQSKKMWVIIGIIAAIIIVLLILFFVGKQQASVTHQADQVADAIKDKDPNKVKKYVTSDGKKLSKDEAKAFLDILEGGKLYKTVGNEVKEKGESMKRNHKYSDTVKYDSETIMNIDQDGKKWLFFDDYKFDIPNYSIGMDDISDGGTITYEYEGKKHKVDSNGHIGSFPLGLYELKATKKVNDKDYKGQLQIYASQHSSLAHSNFDQIKFNVELDNYSIDEEDTTLYINNKPHDFDSSTEYGPYPPDEKVEVYAVADVEGKNFTSDKQVVKFEGDSESPETVKLSFDDDAIDKQIDKALEKEMSKDDNDDESSDEKVTRDNVIDVVESFEGSTLDTDTYTYKEPEKNGDDWGFSYTDKDGDLAGSYIIEPDKYVIKYDEDGEEIDSGYGK